MVRVVGWFMLVVAAFCAWLAWNRITVMQMMAESGLHRPNAMLELIIVVLCGIVMPIGIAALLLRKKK